MSPEPSLLAPEAIRLALRTEGKADALRQCGEVLVSIGAANTSYAEAMLEREQSVSTYVGEGVAIPHGTNASREHIERAALAVLQFPEGVDWGDGNTVYVCVAIASRTDEHISILQGLAHVLMDPDSAAQLREADSVQQVLDLLNPAHPTD